MENNIDFDNCNFNKDIPIDLSKLQNQLAVFSLKDFKFYKLAVIDHRSLRFEVWGDRMTRWLRYPDSILFNFYDQNTFHKLYEQYVEKSGLKKLQSKEELIQWFEAYPGRIEYLPEYIELLEKRKKEKKK